MADGFVTNGQKMPRFMENVENELVHLNILRIRLRAREDG